MKLFDILPENYFSIFSGKNRNIYSESLLILFSLLQNDENFILKSDFIKALKDHEKEIEGFEYTPEDLESIEEDSILRNTISAKASFICRRLEETGWIDIIMDLNTSEETIILPMYSINLVKCLSDIISDEESSYVSIVHSTYSELKLEDEEQDELLYQTLNRCYANTRRLKIELVSLKNSIKIFQNKLGRLFETNKVLHDYFDVYKKKIIDRYYHPLKTFDSVAKFRRPIIGILEKWSRNQEILGKLVEQAAASNTNSGADIEFLVLDKINYICDTYEKINSLIGDIDEENNTYTKNSANKILYLNNNDKTIKGHLDNILKEYARNVENPRKLSKVLSIMQNGCCFYEQGFIDPQSVTLPILRRFRFNTEPLEVMEGFEASEFVMENFLEETKNIYTDERIYQFMDNAFGGSNEVYSSQIPLVDFDAFVCLILATIKKDDDNCFYVVEEVDKTNIHVNGFSIPNFVYRKKENI